MKRLIQSMFAAAGAMLFLASQSAAQSFPDRPIHIIVPFAPGGPADFITRLVGDRLTTDLGQQVVVENRPGASGATSLQLLLQKPADGYTMALAHDGNLAGNLLLIPDLAYDPIKDFTLVTLVANAPDILLVNPSLPINTVDDLVKVAKEKPGQLNFATAGSGSGGHMAWARLQKLAGIEMAHIPYDGGAPAALAVVSGQADVTVQSPAASTQFIESGQLRAIAVTSAERAELLPDVPTMSEGGYEFDQLSWYGFVVRSGTPEEITDKLNDAVVKILNDPEIKAAAAKRRLQTMPSSRKEFEDYLTAETPKIHQAIRDAGLELK